MEFSRRESHENQYEWYQMQYPIKEDEYYWKYPTLIDVFSSETMSLSKIAQFEYKEQRNIDEIRKKFVVY